jgi:hypothetical protein
LKKPANFIKAPESANAKIYETCRTCLLYLILSHHQFILKIDDANLAIEQGDKLTEADLAVIQTAYVSIKLNGTLIGSQR